MTSLPNTYKTFQSRRYYGAFLALERLSKPRQFKNNLKGQIDELAFNRFELDFGLLFNPKASKVTIQSHYHEYILLGLTHAPD